MKKLVMLVLIAVVAGMAGSALRVSAVEKAHDGKLLRHVVMFKFSESAGDAGTKEIVDAFVALEDEINVDRKSVV